MPFILPEDYNKMKANGEPKSQNTINMYKTNLNKISDETGYTTVAELVKNSRKTIKAINDICVKKPNETAAVFKARKRVFYSAIFMVLPADVLATPNQFYLANKKIQDANPEDFK